MTTFIDKNSLIQTDKILEPIKLKHNENPLGPSLAAIKAAKQALLECHRYPCSEGLTLKTRLAAHLEISPQTITLGNGSEGLLELLAKTYINSKASVVIPNYSFLGIVKIIEKTGAELRIAANTDKDIKASQILEAIHFSTKIIFIVNPNNPTGTYINAIELTYLLDNLPAHILIVIDEAYAEYVEACDYPGTIKLIEKYPNLIVSRTFSKFYGLAGLRLGYMISHPKISSNLNQHCLPFTVNSIALAAAEAALCDHEHAKSTYLLNQQGRNQLIHGLEYLSLTVNPSHTNFVCVDLKQDSQTLCKQLLSYGIHVRPLHDYGLPRHLRISIGLRKDNQYLLEVLCNILYNRP
ncbi:MAG: histidinol-phosphate transaminase [Pseudomonadota bacterium]